MLCRGALRTGSKRSGFGDLGLDRNPRTLQTIERRAQVVIADAPVEFSRARVKAFDRALPDRRLGRVGAHIGGRPRQIAADFLYRISKSKVFLKPRRARVVVLEQTLGRPLRIVLVAVQMEGPPLPRQVVELPFGARRFEQALDDTIEHIQSVAREAESGSVNRSVSSGDGVLGLKFAGLIGEQDLGT